MLANVEKFRAPVHGREIFRGPVFHPPPPGFFQGLHDLAAENEKAMVRGSTVVRDSTDRHDQINPTSQRHQPRPQQSCRSNSRDLFIDDTYHDSDCNENENGNGNENKYQSAISPTSPLYLDGCSLPIPSVPPSQCPSPHILGTNTHRPSHKYNRPLPPSKIRALKSQYETFLLNIGSSPTDHIDQIRLSTALAHNQQLPLIAPRLEISSLLPFADCTEWELQEAAHTSWIDHRRIRDARLAERVEKQQLWEATREAWLRDHTGQVEPEILRCGMVRGSKIPVLVRWAVPGTSLSSKKSDGQPQRDRYELYNEGKPMPSGVRKLLFDVPGREDPVPFGQEGVDWFVDGDGMVWKRDWKRGLGLCGNWWVSQD